MVRLQVLLFSVLREKTGQSHLELSFEKAPTGIELFEHIAAAYPDLEKYRPVIRLAVNQAYAPLETTLFEGDEVALLTPVSGG